MSCSKHPKYQAIRKPRCECYKCWKMYLLKNPEETVDNEKLFRMADEYISDRIHAHNKHLENIGQDLTQQLEDLAMWSEMVTRFEEDENN